VKGPTVEQLSADIEALETLVKGGAWEIVMETVEAQVKVRRQAAMQTAMSFDQLVLHQGLMGEIAGLGLLLPSVVGLITEMKRTRAALLAAEEKEDEYTRKPGSDRPDFRPNFGGTAPN
jgi:hypothetical protein